MKVVLLQDVKKMGKKGDVIEVSDGYGRNVLIRKGLGVEGTRQNLNTAAQRQEAKEFKSQVAADEAVIMAAQLKKVKVVIKVQCGEDGRVFGSVTGKDISEALQTQYKFKLDKKNIRLESPIKATGEYQNVKMHANMYPNVDRKRIEHILDVVHLLPYKNDKAGKFSLGMKQRLGLAVAFVSNPDLIILDEPVNGLDIEGVVEVREIIKKLNAEKNVTFLISSHMAGEIEKTCNKVAVIYESELIATSTTEDALRLHPSMEDYFLSVVKDRRGEIII